MTDERKNSRPINAIGMNIDDLYAEAKNWLDGTPIETDAQADEVGKLRDMIRDAEKAAAAAKKAEREPYAAQVKAIDAEWKPLLEKADLAKDACNSALAPFLRAKETRQREEAAAARAEADQRAADAQAALRAASPDNLEARSTAEKMLKAAQDADRAAGKLERAKPQVAGANRAVGLRTVWRPEVTDFTAFARWAWSHRRDECEAFFTELAGKEGRNGPVSIPGLIVHEERKAA